MKRILQSGSGTVSVKTVKTEGSSPLLRIIDDDMRDSLLIYQSEAAELWPILKEFAETGEVKG